MEPLFSDYDSKRYDTPHYCSKKKKFRKLTLEEQNLYNKYMTRTSTSIYLHNLLLELGCIYFMFIQGDKLYLKVECRDPIFERLKRALCRDHDIVLEKITLNVLN